MSAITNSIVVELPIWLYNLMALNLAVSIATLALRIVDRIENPRR